MWLVTGGCGFIGANLVPRIHALGHPVRVLDNLSVGSHLPNIGVEFIQGDVRDRATVERAVERCETVIHLGAQSGVIPSIEDPVKDFETNVLGTLNVLMASHVAGVRKVVFASSNAALGEVPIPFSEETTPNPISPYGASKLAGEAYCLAFAGSFGVSTVALRFANAYGSFSAHKNSVIAKFLKRLMAGEPLIVYGDGFQTRDFVAVEDVCQAIMLAVQKDCSGEVFQIASGVETKINDLVELIRKVAERDVVVECRERREGEAYRIAAAIDKARRVLGYSPKVQLEDGVRRTYEWFEEQYAPALSADKARR
jgi:UDP-glucose 4-epimerase